MQQTTNLNLNKPEYTDPVDIQKLNDNADVIDSTIADIINNTTTIANESGGFAAGTGAYVDLGYGGAAIGAGAETTNGGAIGYGAYNIGGGGAIGMNTYSGSGFSGGLTARVTQDENGDPIDAIQLGTGTNANEKTLQVYDYQLMDAEGNIPAERLTNVPSATIEDNLTSTSAENALSANQGRVLKSQIDGKAHTSHASAATTYGVGTSSNYGHLKVADNLTTTTSGTALSANQGKQLKAQIDALPIWNVGGKSIETGWGDSSSIVTARTGATIIGHSNEDRLSTSLTYPGCAATGMYSVAIGGAATATGDNSVALGKSTASGYWAVAVSGGEASGGNSFASGTSIASGAYSTAMGYECTASSASSLAIGKWNNASGERSVALGYKNTALDFQFKIGQNAKQGTAGVEASTTGDAFIIGNGTSSLSNPSNAFRVTYSGSVYGTGAYNSSGADIAELYEWQDGNPDNEDRRGLFVTLDGTKIRLATPEDTYIKGVVSASPCLVGDSYSEDWQGKYLTDVFGEKLTQTVHYDAEYEDREIVDEETGEKTTERVMIHDEYDAVEWVINPDYDPEKEYIPREERPEYDYVSSWGKLVLVDDGSCEVNGFATVGEGGKATKSDTQTMYRVMERKDDAHIYVAVG